uniref:ARAD1D25322p n=1 Tax=Blastobotrys adeninivorans TaxID=409370 RepID=A0A060TA94_BLAAD
MEQLSSPLHGVLIPCCLLIAGISIVNTAYAPHGLALAVALAAFKFYRGRPKRVLTTSFQEFELLERVDLGSGVLLKFKLDDSSYLGSPIGHAIDMRLGPLSSANDKTLSYVPITTDLDRGYFELVVRPGDPGASLQEHQVGWFRLSPEVPRFSYEPNMGHLALVIAPGQGPQDPHPVCIALQIINLVVRTPDDLTFLSVYCYSNSPYREDVLMSEDLDEVAQKYPRMELHYIGDFLQQGYACSNTLTNAHVDTIAKADKVVYIGNNSSKDLDRLTAVGSVIAITPINQPLS